MISTYDSVKNATEYYYGKIITGGSLYVSEKSHRVYMIGQMRERILKKRKAIEDWENKMIILSKNT